MGSEIGKQLFKGVYFETPKEFADSFKSIVDDKIKSRIDDYKQREILNKINSPESSEEEENETEDTETDNS